MGKPTYYNQKDRDQFHEGWFGQIGAEMNARAKDGSLTLGGIHKKQTDAFEPHATRSTMPEGKTPGASSAVAPGRTLLSRPTGQPATAPTIPKIPVNSAATSALTSAITPAATSATASVPALITSAVQTTPGASAAPSYFGQPRRTLLSTAPLEDVPGRGVQEAQRSESVEQKKPTHAMGSLSEMSDMHIGEDGELGRGVGTGIKKAAEIGGQSLERGQAGLELSELYNKQLQGDNSPETVGRIREIMQNMPKPPNTNATWEDVLAATMESLPEEWEAFEEAMRVGGPAALGAAALTALLGSAGPQAAFPEEILTVPAAFFRTLYAAGGAAYTVKKSQMAANMAFGDFMQLKDQDGQQADRRILTAAGLTVGGLTAAADTLSGGILSKIPGGKKAVQGYLNKAVGTVLMSDQIRDVVLKAGSLGADVADGVLDDVKAETRQLVVGELTKILSQELEGTEFDMKAMEEVITQIQEGGESALKKIPHGIPKSKIGAFVKRLGGNQ